MATKKAAKKKGDRYLFNVGVTIDEKDGAAGARFEAGDVVYESELPPHTALKALLTSGDVELVKED